MYKCINIFNASKCRLKCSKCVSEPAANLTLLLFQLEQLNLSKVDEEQFILRYIKCNACVYS